MTKAFFKIVVCGALMLPSLFSGKAEAKQAEKLTGVCYRQVTGLISKNVLDKVMESILVKSSGDLGKDIILINNWKSYYTLNGDLLHNTWVHT